MATSARSDDWEFCRLAVDTTLAMAGFAATSEPDEAEQAKEVN